MVELIDKIWNIRFAGPEYPEMEIEYTGIRSNTHRWTRISITEPADATTEIVDNIISIYIPVRNQPRAFIDVHIGAKKPDGTWVCNVSRTQQGDRHNDDPLLESTMTDSARTTLLRHFSISPPEVMERARDVQATTLMSRHMGLPEDHESVVASFLSGIERRSTKQQLAELKRQANVGGRRSKSLKTRTRRNHRKRSRTRSQKNKG